MKSIFNFLFVVCFVLNTFSQTSNLIVFAEEGEPFYLVLNGVRQNVNPETNVLVTDLPGISYKAKIIFEDTSIPDLDKTIYFQDFGFEHTYNVKQNRKGKYVMRYTGQVLIPQNIVDIPQQAVVVFGTPQVATTTTTTTTSSTTNVGNNPGVSVGVNVNDQTGGVNFNMNVNTGGVNNPNVQITETTTTTTTVSGGGINTPPAQVVYVQGYSGPIGCEIPMMPQNFQNAKRVIASKSFDDTKLSIAKQIIDSNCLTSAQVRELLFLFDFEDTRLDFAKYCYGYTYDIGNYFMVNEAFDFESSIEELDEFIVNNY
jgi:hypothetical protein